LTCGCWLLAASCCQQLQAGSRRLRATAACCELLPLPPGRHPEPTGPGSPSSRKKASPSTGTIAIPRCARN